MMTFLRAALAAAALFCAPIAWAATPPTVYLSDGKADENAGSVPVTIRLAGTRSASPTTVLLFTIDGTAKANVDFVPLADYRLTLQPGEARVLNMAIARPNDTLPGETRCYTLKARVVSNGRLGDGTAAVCITDDDAAPPVPPPPPPVVKDPPVPPPPPPAPLPETGVTGLPAIASEFDVASQLQPGWGNGSIPAVGGGVGEPGAYRMTCAPGHVANDDPIVYPNEPGRAHLHQFYGNTLTNAFSTYESLRKAGGSTCNGPLWRSAYWIPALFAGNGMVERPDYVNIYYKRQSSTDPDMSDPKSARFRGYGVAMPNGLRAVMGRRPDLPSSDNSAYFNCDGPGATGGHYATLEEAAPFCPIGSHVGALVGMSSCWNGKLDSPDHRSHLTYADYGGWGYAKCPSTHPYVIPDFFLGSWYANTAEAPMATKRPDGSWQVNWRFSSDALNPPGSTFHADFFDAADPVVKARYTANCLDKVLNCSGGELGDGTQMKFTADGDLHSDWVAQPRFLPIPANPMPGMAH